MPKHVAIIGGGIIGLSTAWYCRQRGWEITIIDRKPAQRDGCSFGNAGMIVPSHFVPLAAPGVIRLGLKWIWNPESPFYIRPRFSWDLLGWLWQFKRACNADHVARSAPLLRDLHLQSRACYEQLESDLPGGFGLQKRGLLMLCRSAETFEEEMKAAEFAARLNVPAEILDAAATAALEPAIEMDVVGSVHYPRDCHLSPNRLMSSLQTSLIDDGCEFLWDTEWTGFSSRGDRMHAVETDRGDVVADEFVLCGGIWSSEISKQLNVQLSMQAGKGYSVTLEKPRELPQICSILTEARVAVTPMEGSLRFGGTMEIAGLDESIAASRVKGIVESIPRYFPAFQVEDFAGLPTWSGLRPCSPDGLPYLGRTSRWQNVIIATGHAMMGISLAPVSGTIVAGLIDSQTPDGIDLRLMSPDRYSR